MRPTTEMVDTFIDAMTAAYVNPMDSQTVVIRAKVSAGLTAVFKQMGEEQAVLTDERVQRLEKALGDIIQLLFDSKIISEAEKTILRKILTEG